MWRRKEAATPADSVAADALDALAIECTRTGLVPLALAPDAGVLELPLPALWDGFQTFSPLMYGKRHRTPCDVRRGS